ncbi:MAG TPA: hypothetical protein EYP04_13605 [Anaerolineae bacterium]|nr:hypothetical protein [Anaerolineae bacterium]
MHIGLTGAFVYLLARRWVRKPAAALLSATVFAFGGYLTSYPPLQLAILEVQTWLPLILWALDLMTARAHHSAWRSAIRWALAAGVGLGVSLLGGHGQAALYVIYLCVAYALFRLWPRQQRPYGQGAHGWLPRMGLIALFLIVGIGLASVQLLPTLAFVRLSTRADMPYSTAASGFTFYDLLQFVFPAIGKPLPALYVGILPLALAGFAVTVYLKRSAQEGAQKQTAHRQIAFWSTTALVALLVSLGGHLYAYVPFYLLAPGFGLFRHQERAAVVVSLALALLAGTGADLLLGPLPRWQKRALIWVRNALAGGLIMATVLTLAFFYGYQGGTAAYWGWTDASVFLALLLAFSVGLLTLRLGGQLRKTKLAAALLGLIVLDLFSVNASNNWGLPGIESASPPVVLAAPLADKSLFRVENEGRLPGNYGCLFQLEDTGGASPLVLARYDRLRAALPAARRWWLLNVKYVLTKKERIEVSSEIVAQMPGADGNTTYLHRLQRVGPRAWLAYQIVVEPDDAAALSRLADPTFDLQQEVILPHSPGILSTTEPAEPATINWASREANRLVLEVTTAVPGLLVLSEVWAPGWLAKVDGVSVPVYRADYTLRAIPVTAGTHQVVLNYDPVEVKAGLVISSLTLGLVVTTFLGLWIRPSRHAR